MQDKNDELLESTWSDDVANDKKHRPQFLDRLSTTVRKEWCRRPQEAHLADGDKYRRLSVDEIAVIQGFDPAWVNVEGVSENDRIALLGNAVCPPVACAIGSVLETAGIINTKSYIEICAGIGGLSEGFRFLQPIAAIEMWDIACKVLRTHLDPSLVVEGRAQEFDYAVYKGKVGLLCGGPPCQPWSQAGRKLGHNDPRDVMGFTPEAVAACQPDAFLFENVPGLISSADHEDYRATLWANLKCPIADLRYGLDYKILDSADYGVPQHRRRVFILGIKNASDANVRKIMGRVIAASTHHDPEKPAYNKKPWVTLREALKDIKADAPWRKWNVIASDSSVNIVDEETADSARSPTQRLGTLNRFHLEQPDPYKIGFWWNKKDFSLVLNDGKYSFTPKDAIRDIKGVIIKDLIGEGPGRHLAVRGDYSEALDALVPVVKGRGKLIYWDMPRLDADHEFTKAVEPGYARSAWLSMLRDASKKAHRILTQEGFFAVQTDEETSHYARMVLDETFGHYNHITTFAWEKKYSPQNDRMTPTDSFDYIIVYSNVNRDSITTKIGLVVKAEDIIEDNDPRGCYTAGHKGAMSGSEKTKFKVNVPPYRWKLLDHSLPESDWKVFDEKTGVLHLNKVFLPGSFYINVQVQDAAGATAEGRIDFQIRKKTNAGDSWTPPEEVWWLIKKEDSPLNSGGELNINTTRPQDGVVGSPYSIILKAAGGKVFNGKMDQPGSGRFWEFSAATLQQHVIFARASFGKTGLSLPSEKKFMDRSDITKLLSVRNWLPWSETGKSEDATRHINKLSEAGYGVKLKNSYAKPEPLCLRLVQLFAPNENDTVISIGDAYATMTSVAIKSGRSAIHIHAPIKYEQRLWNETGIPRLNAVLSKKDKWGISDTGEEGSGDPFAHVNPGCMLLLEVSASKISKRGRTDSTIYVDANEPYDEFIASLRGFLPHSKNPKTFIDVHGDLCVVLNPDEILDELKLGEALAVALPNKQFTIFFERSDLVDHAPNPSVKLIRVPFDIE